MQKLNLCRRTQIEAIKIWQIYLCLYVCDFLLLSNRYTTHWFIVNESKQHKFVQLFCQIIYLWYISFPFALIIHSLDDDSIHSIVYLCVSLFNFSFFLSCFVCLCTNHAYYDFVCWFRFLSPVPYLSLSSFFFCFHANFVGSLAFFCTNNSFR